jgi:CBS domain containing-hemolysin-like protein
VNPFQTEVASVAHSIQLSVAPVFLLSGIGVLLSVLTGRLGRIIDRARPMEEKLAASSGAEAEDLRGRLRWLSRRARLINASITLSTVAALLVAIVVALLFASAFVTLSLALPVAALFIASMLSLVGALVAFLVEVRIATVTIRIGPREPG